MGPPVWKVAQTPFFGRMARFGTILLLAWCPAHATCGGAAGVMYISISGPTRGTLRCKPVSEEECAVNEDTDTLREESDVLAAPNRQLARYNALDPTHPGALCPSRTLQLGRVAF